MASKVLLTRPRLDSEALAKILFSKNIKAMIEPIIEINYNPEAELPVLKNYQAILLTSANGARALAAGLGTTLLDSNSIPVFAVGAATAKMAAKIGFRNVTSADGDVNALCLLVKSTLKPSMGSLLHIAGSRVAGNLALSLGRYGFTVQRECIYSTEERKSLSLQTRNAIINDYINIILFFSPRSAYGFAKLASAWAEKEGDLVNIAFSKMTAVCLSSPVAAELSALKFLRVRIASRPRQTALINEVMREIEELKHDR